MTIQKVNAREVFDSRGNPTIEVELRTEKGNFKAMVPSGASTGSHEALELRDGGSRLNGKGVLTAVKNVNEQISKILIGMDPTKQADIDNAMIELDGTPTKSKLGANAIVGVSMAACRAGAAQLGLPLHKHIAAITGNADNRIPIPQFNVINGGRHAGYEHDIQEYLLLPIGAKSFQEGFEQVVQSYHLLHDKLKKKFGAQSTQLGDEGGFVPPLPTPHERFDILTEVIDELGFNKSIKLGTDAAASEFYKDGVYQIGDKKMSSGELIDYYAELCKTYPIASLEDGMDEDDWDGWKQSMNKLGSKIQLIGDDVFVTNPERIRRGVQEKAANALLLKVNQIGSVTEAFEAAKIATDNDWNVVVSHRSGETEDSFIADLAVGIHASQIKTGAPARSERLAKYNQLLRISGSAGYDYAGPEFR